MFRIWFKCFDDGNHLLRDMVVENPKHDVSRTTKIFDAIKEACDEFDLSNPLWLDSNITEFKRHAKVRFTQDNFMDSLDFSYLEVEVIEED